MEEPTSVTLSISGKKKADLYLWVENFLLNGTYTTFSPVIATRLAPQQYLYNLTSEGNLQFNNKLYAVLIMILLQNLGTQNKYLMYNVCNSIRRLQCQAYTTQIVNVICTERLRHNACEHILVDCLSKHLLNERSWLKLKRYMLRRPSSESLNAYVNLHMIDGRYEEVLKYIEAIIKDVTNRDSIGSQLAISSIAVEFSTFCSIFLKFMIKNSAFDLIANSFVETIEKTQKDSLINCHIYKLLKLYVYEKHEIMDIELLTFYQRILRNRTSEYFELAMMLHKSRVISARHTTHADSMLTIEDQWRETFYNHSNN